VPFAAAPELWPSSRFASPRDFIWDDNEPADMDGHGTHVSGTVGQLTNNGVGVAGMAFNVRIMPVKCIATVWDTAFGAPNRGTDDIVSRAIRYAADNGAKVINMSLGRNGGPAAPLIGEAVRYATGRGVFVAVAGGNDYENGNPVERVAEEAAPVEGAMAVAAVGRSLNRAYYSGVKPYIEIAAPGGDFRAAGASSSGLILQQTYAAVFTDTYLAGPSRYTAPRFDVFTYASYQGTSMATPHVAGFAALLMSQGITNPAAVEAAIKRFATDRGAPGNDEEYGAGLINPRTALRGLGIVK
jgi:serine protease